MLYPARFVSGEPSVRCVGAVHVSVAVPLATDWTVMLKAAKDAWASPSVTVMRMFEYVPTSLGPGVPLRVPVFSSKVAQLGRFEIENVSTSPSGSEAVGLNE